MEQTSEGRSDQRDPGSSLKGRRGTRQSTAWLPRPRVGPRGTLNGSLAVAASAKAGTTALPPSAAGGPAPGTAERLLSAGAPTQTANMSVLSRGCFGLSSRALAFLRRQRGNRSARQFPVSLCLSLENLSPWGGRRLGLSRGSGSASGEGPLGLALGGTPSPSWRWKLGLHAGERPDGLPKGWPQAEEPTDSASASSPLPHPPPLHPGLGSECTQTLVWGLLASNPPAAWAGGDRELPQTTCFGGNSHCRARRAL